MQFLVANHCITETPHMIYIIVIQTELKVRYGGNSEVSKYAFDVLEIKKKCEL